MDYPPPLPAPATGRPLVVRLRNWVGDVVLGVPMLQRLSDAGYALRLVGKGWAPDLLAGHGWPVEKLEGRRLARVAQLRRLAADGWGPQARPADRIDGLSLPFSFGSALEMRLAGLKALGYAHEGRAFLLRRAVPRVLGGHELAVYWHLGDALLGQPAPLPERVGLRIAPAAQARADALITDLGLAPGFIVICPFAGGTFSKKDKRWPHFGEFTAQWLPRAGRPVLICPGPGEVEVARRDFPGARVVENLPLGAYAALLRRAALMVTNDTGPGHLAAAVDTPVLSVLGPTNPDQWRAWGPTVHLQQCANRSEWPTPGAVWDACRPLLGIEG